jgi:putative oxidoreductase
MPESTAFSTLVALVRRADAGLAQIPVSLTALALRFGLAVPFFLSGLTKWDAPFRLADSAVFLFSDEFKLHLFGAEVPFPAPYVTAHLSGSGEIVLPILLALGLFTRFAALGILGMTAIIQLTVPDGWANFHLPWAAMALALIRLGGGTLALDRLWSAPIGAGTSARPVLAALPGARE